MKHKYVMNRGLAFSEEKDLRKLSDLAAAGWKFEGFAMFGFFYKLRQAEPEAVQYSIHHEQQPDSSYWSLFSESGWMHVVSTGDMHVFEAAPEAVPMYTDVSTIHENYLSLQKQFGRWSLWTLLPLILLLVLTNMTHPVWLTPILTVLLIMSVTAFVFSFMPFLAYLRKTKKLNREL
ncbi:DUF2812 domain-containing protein [Alkalicoccus luteus]|uniref:DUF2812 domain-containing protein n=1 Tax=Alkalicoccus luteus TaxID=1237094 RepID=A0A969PQQ0_9BACI|nr:DUF2812 domain-containing protein [Alkalicoccus luteus]NJP38660.1 DUF2812 domain-containing protein [Alkalicoccus luteus]